MRIVTIDIESDDFKHPYYISKKVKVYPYNPKNTIVCMGIKVDNQETQVLYRPEGLPRTLPVSMENVDFLVGHNIKYDLAFIDNLEGYFLSGGKLWDTAIFEYLSSGQLWTYPKLDHVCKKYGLALKSDESVSEFEKGKMSSQIAEDIIVPRNKHDVDVTYQVFCRQYEQIKDDPIKLKLMEIYMQYVWVQSHMEKNGIYVNQQILAIAEKKFVEELKNLNASIIEIAKPFWPANTIEDGLETKYQVFNPGSSQHLSVLMFGGPVTRIKELYEYDEAGEIRLLKSGPNKGKRKTYKEKSKMMIKGMGLSAKNEWRLKNPLFYSTDDETLQAFKDTLIGELSLQKRGADKLYKTYCLGLKFSAQKDGCVRCLYNNTGTDTTRLSSKLPNMQNQHKHFLDVFTSRFGNEGSIIEWDEKQLEICVAALLSQDENLIKIVNDPTGSFHKSTAAIIFGVPVSEVTDAQKAVGKTVNFLILYGGAAGKLSKDLGIELEEAKGYLSRFYTNHPGVKRFQEKVLEMVQKNATYTDKFILIDGVEHKLRESYIQIFTKQRYAYVEGEPPKSIREYMHKKGIYVSFSPTEPKDHPVQGFAALLVADCCYHVDLYLRTYYPKLALFVNNVHDSIIVDCHNSVKDKVMVEVKNVMDQVAKRLESYYNIKINVPFVAEVKEGLSWGAIKNAG